MSLSNPYGQHGTPDHRATVARLKNQAKKEFPNARIDEGTKLPTGTLGTDPQGDPIVRKPDVTAVDPNTGQVLKIYEAARKNPGGDFGDDEGLTEAPGQRPQETRGDDDRHRLRNETGQGIVNQQFCPVHRTGTLMVTQPWASFF